MSKKKNILVTGGAGFIGCYVADELVKQGHDVTVLDDLSGGFLRNVPEGAKFVKGSITDHELVDSLTAGKQLVYHIAAYAAEGLSHFVRRYNYQNNVIGSANIINSCVRHNVECLLYTSSMAVYGAAQTPMDEAMVPAPEDPYGIAKYSVERDIAAASSLFGLPYVIIRPHNVYGEKQNLSDRYRNVIAIFINQVMQGIRPTVYGDGSQTRAFSHIDDVTSCIVRAAFEEKARGEIINLGAATPANISDIAKFVINAFGSGLEPEYLETRYEVKHAFCTTEKSERLLGFKDRISIEQGIKRMVEWARSVGPVEFIDWSSLYELDRNMPGYWKK